MQVWDTGQSLDCTSKCLFKGKACLVSSSFAASVDRFNNQAAPRVMQVMQLWTSAKLCLDI